MRILPAVEARIQTEAQRQLPALLGAGGHLGIYWPLRGEVDLRDLGPELRDRLALPAVERAAAASGDPGRLLYRPWHRGEPLVADGCGIPAPPATTAPLAPHDLALLLVPALAVDAAGIRLGYGGGWYDRLRADPAWARVPALVVLPAACRAATLPRDPWDVPFNGWLDEQGLHWC